MANPVEQLQPAIVHCLWSASPAGRLTRHRAEVACAPEAPLSLSSTDVPQANDPVRVLKLARHLAARPEDALPAEFQHPRDRLFYLGALRTLGALDGDDRPTDVLARMVARDARAGFAEALATSPVGRAWLSWAGVASVHALDPSSAAAFLVACSSLSESTAKRRASTLRRWVEWCRPDADEPAPAPAPAPEPDPPVPVEPPPAPSPRVEPARLVAGLARSKAQLHLDTVELCFLAALHLRGHRGALASFDDDALVNVFEEVCDLVDPGDESPRRRATTAIQRLRDHRLLQRVDGAGLVRAGEYTLTALATAIIDFYLRDDALTKESLVLLTRMLHLGLADIRTRARSARDAEWDEHVVGPLSVTVRDLVEGINRRQRGLDAEQQHIQEEIGRLLHERWLDALDTCQRLLDEMTHTLRELNEVLLRDTHLFLATLQEIQQLAIAAQHTRAEEAVQAVLEQVDVIRAWGSARQRAWSAYYQYVHRFLQDVVRLDPNRALSQRLRDAIVAYPARPYALCVASAEPMRVMRPVESRSRPAPVTREHREREEALPEVAVEDRTAWLEERVFEAIAAGVDRLSGVASRVLLEVPEPEHPAMAGRVTAAVARLSYVTTEREAPWSPVTASLEIGDWTIDGLREAP